MWYGVSTMAASQSSPSGIEVPEVLERKSIVSWGNPFGIASVVACWGHERPNPVELCIPE